MPYLPTAPIIPFLRRKVDENLLRQGRPASGIEQITWELSRITGHAVRSCERQVVRILRGQVTHIWDTTADSLACAIGYGPEAIWGDWYELTSVPEKAQGVRVTWELMGSRLTLRAAFTKKGRMWIARCVELPNLTAEASDREEARAALLEEVTAYMASLESGDDVEALATVIPRVSAVA